MKKIVLIALIAVFALAAFACGTTATVKETASVEASASESAPAEAAQNTQAAADQAVSLEGYGSAGAAADENLTRNTMLAYAIQDEYMARAEYEAILAEYGSVTPFSNIIKAEESHISQLLPLFEAYGIKAPADDAAARIVLPASLEESYQAGVEAEIANIAMYESFLTQDLPADVQAVFENLLAGSQSHLKAFENAAAGITGGGTGNGAGSGNGLHDGSGTAS